MSDAKFTKGPWEAKGFKVVRQGHKWPICHLPLDDFDYSANARLIAAAPDLFRCAEILAALEVGGGRTFPTEEDCAFARTAIAKALGNA